MAEAGVAEPVGNPPTHPMVPSPRSLAFRARRPRDPRKGVWAIASNAASLMPILIIGQACQRRRQIAHVRHLNEAPYNSAPREQSAELGLGGGYELGAIVSQTMIPLRANCSHAAAREPFSMLQDLFNRISNGFSNRTLLLVGRRSNRAT